MTMAQRLTAADWDTVLPPLEATLRSAGVPMPLQMARGLLAALRRRTPDGRLAAVYQREAELELLEEALQPLLNAAEDHADALSEIQRSQDQILELLFRVVSNQFALTDTTPKEPEVPIVEYRIARGWAGMYHLLHGGERLFGGEGTPPRLLDTPAMALVRALQPLVGGAEGEPETQYLDVRTLADAGAPVGPEQPRSRWMRPPSPGVDPGWWLRRTENWIDLRPGCGYSLAEASVAQKGMTADEIEKRGRALEDWMLEHCEIERGEWLTQARAPIIEVLPVHVYCLYLRGPVGTSLSLIDSDGHSLLALELDQRPLLVPLGLSFEDRDPAPEGNWCGPSPDVDDPNDPLFDMFATHHPHSLCERLEAIYTRMRGPRLEPVGLSWRCGEAHGRIELRGPRRVWDCVNHHFAGASCPELFIRVDDRPWRYLGPVLVGADAPTRCRWERHELGSLEAGREACVVLRELPGELATLEARLWARAGDKRWMLDAVPITQLDAHALVILRAPVQGQAVELYLDVDGFFVRLSEFDTPPRYRSPDLETAPGTIEGPFEPRIGVSRSSRLL
jgi:hypothetical protein